MHTKTLNCLDNIDIDLNTLVLTANQRLALRTQQAYDKKQIQQGHVSWPTPLILPLITWLQHLAATQLDYIVLAQAQELYLWESLIQHHHDEAELLNPSDTATLTSAAWQTLQGWNIDFNTLADHPNQEVALFHQWCLQFNTLLQTHQWITTAQIPALLMAHSSTILNPDIHTVLLIGFDELPPAIDTLLRHLTRTVNVWLIQIEKKAQSIQQTVLHDQQTEIETMAMWAKQQYDAHPHAKIGCIIPQLETLRRDLFNVFTQVLHPERLLPGHVVQEKKFNISIGQRLHEYPLIRTALDIIDWLTGHLDVHSIGATLQSPYWHQTIDEQDDAARIDCALRELNAFQLPFSALFEASMKTVQHTDLTTRLSAIKNKLNKAPAMASLTQWVLIFTDLLDTAGWPGCRTLNSEEYQVGMRWHQLLDEYTRYNLVCEQEISLAQALYLLHKQVSQTLFQPEGSQSRIQVLGVLEAAGNDFDYMWVMGLDDEAWPAAPQPNPFIPYLMQKECHMPHASAERELLYTRQMMQRLIHSAQHIIFSSAQYEADKHKNPSRLLQELTHEFIDIPLPTPSFSYPATTSLLESMTDTQAPRLSDDEISEIRGGSAILKHQSQCPFKAFATLRLRAEGVPQPDFAISARERGLIIHDVLERIWKKLGTQAQLKQLSTPELDECIEQSITQAISDLQGSYYSPFKKHLFEIEKKRIQSLIQEWLDHEKQRPPFTVNALESIQKIQISRLSFLLRIDRIDTLENGEQIVIDYKTNSPHLSTWFGDRPHDPQCPLYLSGQVTYDGVAYAEVKPNQCSFKGIMCSDTLQQQLPGSTSIEQYSKGTITWPEQIKKWQDTLYQLTTEFESGLASVTPTHPQHSCAYCDLKPLCRVEITPC